MPAKQGDSLFICPVHREPLVMDFPTATRFCIECEQAKRKAGKS
jgi:hypothetical protein